MTGEILSNKNNNEKIIRKNSYFYKTSTVLRDESVKNFLHNFQKQFVTMRIDKVSNNFSFI